MNDIGIDLETLSTRHDAAILSIGATAFDRVTGKIGATYYAEVDIDDAIKHGHVMGSTLAWWVAQSAGARAMFEGAEKNSLLGALVGLREFVNGYNDCRVWGNGATFDVTILENAYVQLGMSTPWEFYNVRDMRTIVDLASELGFDKRSVEFMGTAHNARDDSIHQAKVVYCAWDWALHHLKSTAAPVQEEPITPETV